MIEEWKFYKETYCNRHGHRVYEVSNLGRVKLNGEIIKPKSNGMYYWICGHYLHKIVAELFIPNPENKPEIDHINGNKSDNRVENLRWVTHSENMNNTITREHISKSLTYKRLSDETKQKISAARKGKPHSEETKQKIREGNLGKKRSEDTKHKISAAHKGMPCSEDIKQKIREGNLGKKLSEEHKQKLSAVHKGKKLSEKSKQKISAAQKGKKHSEDTKQKISAALKEYRKKEYTIK